MGVYRVREDSAPLAAPNPCKTNISREYSGAGYASPVCLR